MKVYLGIDWGGTYIKSGVVNENGKLLEKRVFVSTRLRDKKVFLEQIEVLVKSFHNYKISAIGIGAPGVVNREKGFIYYLPNVAGWKNYPLTEELTKKIKLPVYLDNDANAFALAEANQGAGIGKERVLFLTLGTGLGGAFVSKGKLLEGKVSALEIGHVPVSLNGKKCGCGSLGCIETYTGSNYLISRYVHLKKGKVKVDGVKDIFLAARKGDVLALRVWQEFSFALGMFLVGMVNVFNPDIIVFGGGVSGGFVLFRPLVNKVIKDHAMWPYLKNLSLAKAKLKDAGVIGAGLLCKI